jgi:dipeptidyl aminopeptidase/acylaminoacyl peptidase
VLRTTDGGRGLLLVGAGASSKGDRPFLDEIDLRTKKTRRLYRSRAPFYEVPIDVLDDAGSRVLLSRETNDAPPNYWVRDLGSKKLIQLTRFPHPTPELKGIKKQLIRYRRDDGVMLTATLYLPKGYAPRRDGRLPMVMWAYPQEFKSKDAAGQVKDSPHRFVRVNPLSPLVWLTRGYAVLDDPAMPIVGEGQTEPNDTYVAQLVASARAAVDDVVRRGIADRDRIAIGGHSYGAFTTANLLAHSDLFRAGVARSGAYNRTLTPFGFQSEERTFWEAPQTYVAMSPYVHANTIDEPLLMIHGAVDDNPGTYPVQRQ